MSDDQAPRVAVVVLNYNRPDDTLLCLDSLEASDWPSITVIVVDNGSAQTIAPAVAERHPEAISIRTSENLGFAGGMNVGLARALELEPGHVLLLNNDTIVDPAMIRVLVQTAAARPDTGIVSPLVIGRGSEALILSAGWDFDPRRGHPGRPLLSGTPLTADVTGVRETVASSGEAMLVPSAVARDVGGLDEALFLRLEDIDWSLRMREHGYRNYTALDAHLWHAVSASSGGDHSALSAYYHTRNMLAVCARHAPLRPPRSLVREAEVVVANLAHARRGRRPVDNARAAIAGWQDFRRGRMGARGTR